MNGNFNGKMSRSPALVLDLRSYLLEYFLMIAEAACKRGRFILK